MAVIRRTFLASDTLEIGGFEARPTSDACGDVERQATNIMVLPVSGVFARHDAPGRQIIGTPSHAVLIAADTPYRLSFPGAIGDRALLLRYGRDLADDHGDRLDGSEMASHGLLPARALMLRNLLWKRFARGELDAFAAEALGLDLLGLALASMRTSIAPTRHATHVRRTRALQRVKEAVALAPADPWTVARLARIANLSPFHLCHVFRETVGASLYDYVLRERLAQALEGVLDGDDDLTAIALDAGFASHSHFTAHFRRFFGSTPTALRRLATVERVAQLRKIATARRRSFH